jgi:hypothetical protein
MEWKPREKHLLSPTCVPQVYKCGDTPESLAVTEPHNLEGPILRDSHGLTQALAVIL